MILLTNPQIIYISSSVVLFIIFAILLFIYLYKAAWAKFHYKEASYLVLSHMANINDYLLLNNYKIDFDDSHVGVIDHILITKKYIYVINDFSISGVVSGDLRDRFLRVVTNKKEVKNISNPLNYNINLIKRLNLYNHLDQSFVKGLVVVNNDAYINIANANEQFMMIRRKDLNRIIAKHSKDKVNNLKEGDVVNFINKLDKQNHRRGVKK